MLRSSKRRIVSTIVILIFAGALIALKPPSVVEYVPIVSDGRQQLVQDRTLLTAAHLDRLEVILQSYGVAYKRADVNHLLIPRSLSNDRDLLWNYTSKAEDLKSEDPK